MSALASPLADYVALTAKVDAFADAVSARCASQISCRSGCAGCCQVDLTVSSIEAASIAEHLRATRAEAEPPALGAEAAATFCAEDATADALPRCVFLSAADACLIYPVRPLVCRSQGLPLRYPSDFLPEAAVRLRVRSGAVTICPLNFVDVQPSPHDVLDAERVDQILALLNLRYCREHGLDPEQRVSLRALRDSAYP